MAEGFQQLLGIQLADHEIDEVLTDVGVGVLSMSADGVPYGVPLSFGYDGDDRLYFLFLDASSELRKEALAEECDEASFTTFDINPDGSWRSVIVAGPLDRITHDEWDVAREAMVGNAYKSNLFSDHEIQDNPNVWALETAERSGRGVGYE